MCNQIYEAMDIGQYVIGKCYDDEYPISNLQLQEIMYILQRGYLQQHGQPLFTGEIQAWQAGPIVPQVY